MRGGTASRHQTGLSLQKWELQGDFDKMQGGGGPSAAKSTQISMALDGLSLLSEQGGYGLLAGRTSDHESRISASRCQTVQLIARDTAPAGIGWRTPIE
jgi:hypothetical protein